MVESVLKKANARLKCLYRKNDFLYFHTRKQLVTVLFQCHFDYACSVWYNDITQNLKNMLQTSQHKLIKLIFILITGRTLTPNILLSLIGYLCRVDLNKSCCVMSTKLIKTLHQSTLNKTLSQTSVHSYSTILGTKGGYLSQE